MNITTSITLNMQTPGYVVAYEPQGNKLSRFITATLKDGSASWSVPSGATAMIRVAKPDGTFAVYDKNEKGQTAYTISGSTVTIELVGAALAAAGDALVTVMFLDSTGSNLSPFSFRLVIMPTAVSDDDIASSDYFNVFQDTINQLQAFYGAPLTAATASAMTDTTRVYVYVGSESGYVYGHWYYYNGSTWVNGGVYNSEGINSNWLYAAYPVETISNAVLAHFNDGADDVPVKTLRLAINLVQNLHGYDNPWPGGGKNLIPLTVERIKAANTTGTWSGNAYTYRGVTFTLITDDGENVTGVQVTGTNTAGSAASIMFPSMDVAVGTYYFNGLPDGVQAATEYLGINVSGSSQYLRYNVSGRQLEVTATDEHHTGQAWISVTAGSTASGLVYLPMLRKSDVSDATFAPFSNICPISGRDAMSLVRTGSNLISPFDGYETQTHKGITTTFDGENVSVVGTSTGGNTNSTNMPLASPLKLFAGKTYIFAINGNFATPNLRLRLRNESGDLWYGDSNNCIWTVTPTTDLTITRVGFRVTASGSTIDVSGAFYCNLNALGTYEPYKGTIYEVSFGSAGTIYGGTLTYNGDGTWTLTVDHYAMTVTGADITATINLGDVIRTNLVYVESGKNATGRNALAISNWLPRIAANYSGNAMGFYFDTESRVYIKAPNNAIGITSETSGVDRLALTKAYFDANPLLIVYPLATALSFTLTGPEVLTLLGINNIWADTGDIEELAYRADIGLYLVEALNPIKEMLAYREDTMTATRAYTTGDFIVVGDTFYKAATAIANGATLTPGTNVNATTVGAQLKLLS